MNEINDLFNTENEIELLKSSKTLLDKEQKKQERTQILTDREVVEQFLKEKLPPLPDKQYQVIYIDPPWRYEFSKSNSREIENQYPTMELEDIKALPIGKLAAADSIIFMWATSPKLEGAFEVLNAYGFKYVTSAVWDKIKIGMGYYFRGRHELLLVGKKGNLPVPTPKNRVSSVIEIPRGKHSKKPVEFYSIIEKMYPTATKIEIFSRIKREGWDTWGLEEGTLKLPENYKLWGEAWEE